jgi:hypothetical protein
MDYGGISPGFLQELAEASGHRPFPQQPAAEMRISRHNRQSVRDELLHRLALGELVELNTTA